MRKISNQYVMVLLLSAMTLFISTSFNACSDVKFEQSQDLKSKIETQSILINNNSTYTTDVNVNLKLFNPFATEMMISDLDDCSVGSWEPYKESRSWVLSKENDQVSVYVKYKVDGDESACSNDSIIHDNIPPAITVLDQIPDFTINPNQTINFDVTDSGSGVDQILCSLTLNAQFSACSTTVSLQQLSEGAQQFYIKATDQAGNIADPSDLFWKIDLTKPTVSLNITPAKLDNKTSAHFEFTAIDSGSGIDKIMCKLDSGVFEECQSPLDKSSLAEGAHSFMVKAIDKAGHESEVVSYDWVIDITAPSITITKYPAAITNDSSALFEFIGMDGNVAINDFECSLDGSAYSACSSPKTYTNLSDGTHVFSVRGRDNAGNLSASASYSWLIDSVKPTISIIQNPDKITNSVSAAFLMDAKDLNGTGIQKIECLIDQGVYADCTNPKLYNGLSEGGHTFKARAYDNAGNVSDEAMFCWSIDLTKPVVTIVSGPDLSTQSLDAEFAFSGTDVGAGIESYQCKIDGGDFELCSSPKNYMNLTEGAHIFYVKATDKAGNVSDTAMYNWNIDNTAPVITFVKYPTRLFEGQDAVVFFAVSDAGSGVDSLTCYLDANLSSQCEADKLLIFNNQQLGDHTYRVVARDKAGNSAAAEVTWEVVKETVDYADTVAVTKVFKTDILFVVDSSGSMQEEMRQLADRINNFLTIISDLDWQIAVATVDPQDSQNDGDGKFVDIQGGRGKIIHKSDPDALNLLSNTITSKTNGSGKEQGIRAVYRAVERFEDPDIGNDAHREFFREDAHIAVILISDEDENSNGTNLGPLNMPTNLIGKIKNKWPSKNFVFNSIVWNPLDSAEVCPTASYKGVVYSEATNLTNGVIGSVCSNDYAEIVKDLGERVVKLQNTLQLQCAPVDKDKDGIIDVAVQYRASSSDPYTPFNQPFNISGYKLVFATGLVEGDYKVDYSCLKYN